LDGGEYVEGWAVEPTKNDVFAHGWIVLGDRIVDPLRYWSGLFYFPGKRFGREAIAAEVCETTAPAQDVGEPSLLCHPGHTGVEDPSFEQSRRSAQAFAEELAAKMKLVWKMQGTSTKGPPGIRQGPDSIAGDAVSRNDIVA
jgi:hypothetical protein